MALTSDTMQAIMNYAQAMREADARKRAALAEAIVPNMARRGITVPAPAPGAPLLPEQMSAEQAPPFWAGAMPQASTSPIMAGINPEVPLPINTGGIPVSGANMTPAKPQGVFNKIMSTLADPRVGAYLTNLGAGLGAQRMPGQSEMQVIAQGLRQGYGGMLNENQRQQQLQMANRQMEMTEREQARKEAETASGISAEGRRVEAYENQVKGSIEQGKASIAQRGAELEAEKNWRKRAADLEQARVNQDWKKHENLIKQQEAELALASRKVALDEEAGKRDAELQPLRLRIAKLQAEAQIARSRADLARIAQESGGKNPRAKSTFDMAGKIYASMAQTALADVNLIGKKTPEEVKKIFKTMEDNAVAAAKSFADQTFGSETSQPSDKRIRVKLSNGTTGTILESEFDPKTMTKVE